MQNETERQLGNPKELVRAQAEEVITTEKYQVTLSDWTGPFDVLLQIIDEKELNLLDLDISKLLDAYLEYLETAAHIDIDEAGEFLVVAATLAQIKSKLLLPKEETPNEEEEKDPREELVRYLIEYQKIKQAAELLKDRPLLGRDVFVKGVREHFEGAEGEGRGQLFQLVRGFQKALRDLNAQIPMQLTTEVVAVSDRLNDIFHELKDRREMEFSEVFAGGMSKVYVVASFLAVLELVRLKKVKIYTSETFGLFLRMVEGAEVGVDVHSEFDDNVANGATENDAAEDAVPSESIA